MANIRTSGVFNLGALGGDGAASGGDSNWDDVVLLLDGSSTSDVTGLSTVTPSASGYSTNQTAGADGPKFIQYIDFQNIPAGYFNVAFPSALGVSNEPFTVETWAYFDAISNDGVFQLYQSGFSLDGSAVTHTASIAVAVSSSAWLLYDYGASTSGLGTASTGNWYHVAVVYDGTDLVLYVDGVALRTIARSMPAGGLTSIGIGGYYTTGFVMDGRIEGFRVTKGVARYTAAFNTDPVITSPAAWPTSAPVAAVTRPTRRWGGITGRSLVETAADTPAFNAVAYTGTRGTQAVTGLGFQPDFVWLKARTIGYVHGLFDTVRGGGNHLAASLTNAEISQDANGYLSTFDTDGFTLIEKPTNTGVAQTWNDTSEDYIAWAWKAGGAPTATNNSGQTPTSGSVMIDGVASTAQLPTASIYPTKMSVNTQAGFSIIMYLGKGNPGDTVPHGLGFAPDMIIIKDIPTADNWAVYHSGLGGGNASLFLEANVSVNTSLNMWNSTAPSSSVFTLGDRAEVNRNTDHIAYCWHSVPGFSKFGSYTGSGGAGNKVTTGFKPAFVMIKSTGSNNWVMIDNKRSPTNPADEILYADQNWVEATGGTTTSINFLADGFDFGGGGGSINSTGSHTYIYMAFAEEIPSAGDTLPTTGVLTLAEHYQTKL